MRVVAKTVLLLDIAGQQLELSVDEARELYGLLGEALPSEVKPAATSPERTQKTVGETSYELRQTGMLWREVAEQLESTDKRVQSAAREYATRRGLQWPIKLETKAHHSAPAKGKSDGQLAYETGKAAGTWRCAPFGGMTRKLAKDWAERSGAPWPAIGHPDEKAAEAYRLRMTGMNWTDIVNRLGYRSTARARAKADSWCRLEGLPLVSTVPMRDATRGAEAFRARGRGMSWAGVARKLKVDPSVALNEARAYARKAGLTLPVVETA